MRSSFFPFGLTVPYALGGKVRRPVAAVLLSAFALTCAVELIQFLFSFGNAELSDIVCNTLGAGIGTLSYLICSGVCKK